MRAVAFAIGFCNFLSTRFREWFFALRSGNRRASQAPRALSFYDTFSHVAFVKVAKIKFSDAFLKFTKSSRTWGRFGEGGGGIPF